MCQVEILGSVPACWECQMNMHEAFSFYLCCLNIRNVSYSDSWVNHFKCKSVWQRKERVGGKKEKENRHGRMEGGREGGRERVSLFPWGIKKKFVVCKCWEAVLWWIWAQGWQCFCSDVCCRHMTTALKEEASLCRSCHHGQSKRLVWDLIKDQK